MTEFKTKIETLQKLRNNNVHNKYIEHIRYPRFRNLEDKTRIDFNFPITFLVGKNGGGKSSTLHSLFGCPEGYSIGTFWFTTELDPIKEFENDRNCFIYGYYEKNKIVEVLKQRAHRDDKPDNWETNRPVKKYGMNMKQRVKPLEKNVVYIDFRSELSAFDKFMHFSSFSRTKKYSSKQDYLRFYTKKLKSVFEKDEIIQLRGKNKNEKKIKLSDKQIKVINNILGKNYSEVEIINHSLFKDWGTSIRLKSPDLHYSEAFAGSGETAIVMLVHKIFNAPEESLILLDEPETSLHSGAQKRLIRFILDTSIEKKHQYVISTHSPFLIENMPDNSIKVFSTIKTTGKFIINSERNYKEAFHELEVENKEIKTILVEDNSAKIILDKMIEKLGADTKSLFDVLYLPGGASDINQRISTIMDISDKAYVLFDGDQNRNQTHIDLSTIPLIEQDTLGKLKTLIKNQTGSDIKFFLDGGNKDNTSQETELCKKYLNFYKDKVFYFPTTIPEDIIWDETYAKARLKLYSEEIDLNSVINGSQDSKEKLYRLSVELNCSIEVLYNEFTKKWLDKKGNENFEKLKTIITKLKKL